MTAKIGKRLKSLLLIIACTASVITINAGCVRNQDASETADLVLLRVLDPVIVPGGNSDDPAPTIVPATFAVTDNLDGTVTVEVQNLLWAKCSQVDAAGANTFNSGPNDCTNGTAGVLTFCAVNDDSCNGGVSTGVLDGGGSSPVWDTCANLNLGGRTSWRVPSKEEIVAFYFGVFQVNPGLFDSPASANFWTRNSAATTAAYQLQALSGLLSNTSAKTSSFGVRCVHSLP